MISTYYVYFYLRKNFSPYYVGKGKNNRAWKKDVGEIKCPKDKSKIILVEQNLTELQAFTLERYYIRWFGRKDLGTGILRNRTDGGEGSSGRILSEETKRKISLSEKGKEAPNKGKPHSEQTKKKISEKHKGRPAHNKGKSASEETRDLISKKLKGRPAHNKGKSASEETKRKISEALTGKPSPNKGKKGKPTGPLSYEHKQKLSVLKKGIPQKQITCPVCNKIGGITNMKRYHFEKCKHRSHQLQHKEN